MMDAAFQYLADLMTVERPVESPKPVERVEAPVHERLSLPGGRAAVLRSVEPDDADAVQAFVSNLSLASRHKRFHVGLRQLSPSMLRQMTEVDQRNHVAWVAQVVVESEVPVDGKRLVADARYVRDADNPDEAEFAIAVADDWQSLGLGRMLIARLAAHAKRQGLKALVGDVLPENRRMLVLMRGLGAETRAHPDGPQLVRVVFPL
jgi:acetyltransferase